MCKDPHKFIQSCEDDINRSAKEWDDAILGAINSVTCLFRGLHKEQVRVVVSYIDGRYGI
jgi:hypothetical protein